MYQVKFKARFAYASKEIEEKYFLVGIEYLNEIFGSLLKIES